MATSRTDTSCTDRAIDQDLGHLADVTAENLPASSEVRERLGSAGPYRDGRAGASARRDELFEERRVELALMPLRLQRVFVHRAGRVAAGATAILGGVGLAVALIDPVVLQAAGFLVPGTAIELGLAAALVGILGAYLVGVFVGERILDRSAQRLVSKSDDVYADLDLPRPVHEARRLARRIDAASSVLPLLGITILVPLLAFAAICYHPLFGLGLQGGFLDYDFASGRLGLLARNLSYVVVAVFFCCGLSVLVWRGLVGEVRGRRSRAVALLEHWSTPLAAVATALITGMIGARAVLLFQARGAAISPMVRWGVSALGVASLALSVGWLLLVLRRREERSLELADGIAAGG